MTQKESNNKYNSERLFENIQVKRWYNNVKRGSKKTADVYLRRLSKFCGDNGISPNELIQLSPSDIFNLMLDYITEKDEENKKGSYIRGLKNGVDSWLAFNNIHNYGKVKIKGAYLTPTLDDEQVPSHEELHRIFTHANPRERLCCALMAHGGLRPGVIGDGNDGLRVKDFPELKIEGEKVTFEKIPTIIRVRAELSKTGKAYMTFLSEQGCGYLSDYLEARLREGQDFKPKTDIVTPRYDNKMFLSTVKVRESIRRALRRADVKKRPYVLRAYFNTQLQIAESKGKMISSYRQLFFGHSGPMENRYSTSKGKLTEEMMEDMRESYRESQVFLQTTSSNSDTSSDKEKFLRMMFRSKGMSKDDIENHDLDSLSEEEMMSIVEELDQKAAKSNGRPQKIVSMDEAEELIEEGWEYIRDWTKGRVILKAP